MTNKAIILKELFQLYSFASVLQYAMKKELYQCKLPQSTHFYQYWQLHLVFRSSFTATMTSLLFPQASSHWQQLEQKLLCWQLSRSQKMQKVSGQEDFPHKNFPDRAHKPWHCKTRPRVNCAGVCNPQATTVYVDTGWYLVVLGQYQAVLVGTWWHLVALGKYGRYWLVLSGAGSL